MTPDDWKLAATIGGTILATVTGPILWAIRAEGKAIRTEMELMKTELRLEMTQMEKRLNERIDTRLVHR